MKELRGVGNDYNPRTKWDDAAMNELVQSISSVGLIQPLSVRKTADGKYEVIAGMRRFTALNKLYPDDYMVSCNLLEADDKEAMVISTTENLARASMSVMDEARAFAKYFNIDFKSMKTPGIPQKDAIEYGKKIGIVAETIRRRINLLRLSEVIQ